MTTNANQLMEALEALLTGLHEQQRMKVKRLAQQLLPELTDEDLLNPDDFPALARNPHIMYEDGLAAGILSAKIAVRAYLKGRDGG